MIMPLMTDLVQWLYPRVPVHKNRYKRPNNKPQITKNQRSFELEDLASVMTDLVWLYLCVPVHKSRYKRPNDTPQITNES